MRRIYFTLVLAGGLVLAFLLTGHAQSFSVLQGKVLTQDGKPVTNQPFMIEGYKEQGWGVLSWFLRDERPQKVVRVLSVTDLQGKFQIVNLPAGQYTIKLLRAGIEPIAVKEFNLGRGYGKTEIAGVVSTEQLGRQVP